MDLDSRVHAYAEPSRGYRHPQAERLSSIAEGIATAPKIDPRQDSFLLDESEGEVGAQHSEMPKKRQRMTYYCEDCGTSYTEKRTLARHRHTDQHRQRVGLPPIRKYPCTTCGKLFGRDHDRHRHENEKHKLDSRVPASDWSKQESARKWPMPEQAPPPPPPPAQAPGPVPAPYTMMPHTNYRSMTPSTMSPVSMVRTDTVSTPSVSPVPMAEGYPDMEPMVISGPSYTQPQPTIDENSAYPMESHSASQMDDVDYSDIPQPTPPFRSNSIPARMVQNPEDSNAKTRNDSAVNIHFRNSNSPSTRNSGGSSDIIFEEETPRGVSTSASTPTPTQNFTRQHVSLIQRQGKTNVIGRPRARFCIMCEAPFEHDLDGLIPHLRQHMDTFRGTHFCSDCQIGFVHGQDLERHRKSAEKGHCGFSFTHDTPCNGHHPPEEHSEGGLSDRDRFQLCNQLRHWEQSQLRTYITDINNLVSSRTEKDIDSYSIEALIRQSRNSFGSFAVSVNTHATAPCDQTEDGKWDIGGLQRRLKLMSVRDASEQVQQIVKRDSAASRATILNKDLYKAVYRGDLTKVEKSLASGADGNVLRVSDPVLTAAAMWSRSEVWQQTSAHKRLNERNTQELDYCECALSSPSTCSDADLVRAMLQHGADPQREGGLCGYPLSTAAYMGKAAVVQVLLDHGADLNYRAGKYATPLCFAAAGAAYPGNRDVIRILVEAGAERFSFGPEGDATQIARKQRDMWSLRAMEMNTVRNEVRERVECCEKTIKFLELAGGPSPSKGKWLKW